MDSSFDTPVALFVFNRPETTRKVLAAIAEARPSRLLLIADGPRSNRAGEAERCREVRSILETVDWPCTVATNFSDDNLGCQERMISGLDWVFTLEDEAIILEDDCLPHASFFPFCRELLERYRGDQRVAYIAGSNLVGEHLDTEDSYFFSEIGGIWGWATWREEWRRYDRHLSGWPLMKKRNELAEVFSDRRIVAYWTRIFDAMYAGTGPNTWDYQWLFTTLKNHSVAAVPSRNLITNIGFGRDATHTIDADRRFTLPSSPVTFPLRHPHSFIPLRSLDRHRVRDMFPPPIPARLYRKVRRTMGRA